MPDYKPDDSRWEDWLVEQHYYWENGYQIGGDKITGRYYFLLNFSTIEALDERNYAFDDYPIHVDVLKELTDLIDDSILHRKNIFVWKARDKSFSYTMSSIALGEMMMEKKTPLSVCFRRERR